MKKVDTSNEPTAKLYEVSAVRVKSEILVKDRFYTISENAAKREFLDCYRHDVYRIVDVHEINSEEGEKT